MGTKATNLSLPAQPMDCCICDSAPLIASGMVNGHIMMHRYSPYDLAAAAADREQDQPQDAASTSYTVSEVFSRPSKKGASCRAVCFTGAAEQQYVVAGFETGTLLQLDAGSGGKVLLRLTKAHNGAGINRLLAIQDQRNLVAAGDDSGGLYVWDLRTQAPVYSYTEHTDYISGLTQHTSSSSSKAAPGGQQMLLAVSGDGTLSVHDLRSRKALAHSETDADDELLSVAVVKRGKKVVCGSQSGVLAIWSWGYWADCSDRFPGHPESVDAIVKFDEDTVITGSSDGALRAIGILPNKLLGVVGQHAQDMPVERLAVSSDRQVLASVSHDSCIKLWDLALLQDDSGDSEADDGGDDHDDGSSEWEEADSQDAGEQQQHAEPKGTADTDGQAGSGSAGGNHEQGTSNGAAAAVAAAATGGGDDDGDNPNSSSSDDDDDERGGSRKRKKQRQRTAMKKGAAKHTAGGNFFADLL